MNIACSRACGVARVLSARPRPPTARASVAILGNFLPGIVPSARVFARTLVRTHTVCRRGF